MSPEQINREWRTAGTEPTLDQVLADPIVHLVMRRDGVEIAELKHVIAQAQAALGGARVLAAAVNLRPSTAALRAFAQDEDLSLGLKETSSS